jgi:glutaryl-CoA dehydrogenase
MKPDLFQSQIIITDDLLTEEHKLVRDSARAWVKEVSPIIEEYAQKAEFPKQIIKVWVKLVVWSLYSEEYGGAGLDQISYGIMQEIERGDSGVRSTSSVQSSLVMYPIWKYGNEEQRMKYLPKLALVNTWLFWINGT